MKGQSKGWRLGALMLAGTLCAHAEEKKPEPAELRVSGLGWWDNREQRVALERVLGDEREPVMGAGAVEDAAFMLVSALVNQGYLRPEVRAVVTPPDGGREVFTFDEALDTLLPRELAAKAVRFEVTTGVRSVFDAVEFSGLTAVMEEKARGYFLPNDVPLLGAEARAYSPSRLRRAAAGLETELRRLGFAEAVVKAEVASEDLRNGKVRVRVTVEEGPLWRVTAVRWEGVHESDLKRGLGKRRLNEAWSNLWQQDVAQHVRRGFYERGYADVRVEVDALPEEAKGGLREVAAVVRVAAGPQVKVGEVRFEGNTHTHESILRRRVRAEEGDWLDPVVLDNARYRLARLGAFETVDVRLDSPMGEVRDAVFTVKELPRWDASLLAGYGSYEQLRGGLELEQTNLLGRAHASRLLLVQSMKSTRGEYNYTVPELFGEAVDGTARVFGLQREEEAFLRREYGATTGVRRRVPWLKAEGTLGYTYQSLSNRDSSLATSASDEENVNVASINVGLSNDRRDNPLRPRRGYRWYVQSEFASERLGGEVDYQAFEGGVSYHTSWGRSRWIHLGLTHGVITQWGAPKGQAVPVNRLFFPGGESSIRGYQQNEAAPRAADGRFVGAETYGLLNVEVEQAITRTWTIVVFGDALGTAADLSDYPFSEELFSVGLGVRYQTIVGPVRLEYGRNINPREGDPLGTLHFSVGFPF